MEEEIRKDLFNMQDKKYKEFHSSLSPNVDNIIGIKVPVLRNYAKELLKKYKQEEIKIGDKYYEELLLQGMIIGLQNRESIENIIVKVNKFVPKINSWGVCDTFCAGLKITKKYQKEMFGVIEKYLKSNKEYELRFAIVMLLDYYINDEYIDTVLKILNRIKLDKYYVQIANAWAISICLIKYYEKTVKFLEGCNLDNFTYNKAIQKAIESYRITDKQKEDLRKMKR